MCGDGGELVEFWWSGGSCIPLSGVLVGWLVEFWWGFQMVFNGIFNEFD